LVLMVSWAPASQMSKLTWIPKWVGGLADRDPNFRTAVQFVPLAFFLFLGFSGTGLKWPLLWSVLVSGLCLGLSEFGQRFLPMRTADVKDLIWGTVGIAGGTLLAWGWRKRGTAKGEKVEKAEE
jgi:hypothetical protein